MVIEKEITVTVADPFQVFHEGQARTPGETITVPISLAQKWIEAGWVVEAATKTSAKEAS